MSTDALGQVYTDDSIKTLKDAAHIRQNPGMYVGNTDVEGLHHLVYEIVYNSVDEALAGFCKRIDVTIHHDGSISVADDGRGIPVGIKKDTGRSTLEEALTIAGTSGKFDNAAYRVSAGLHGMGAKAMNALSEWCEAVVKRDGRVYKMEFERGYVAEGGGLQDVGPAPAGQTGTVIKFKPDPEIFGALKFDYDRLATRFQQIAFLNKGLVLAIKDEGENRSDTYVSEKGIVEYVAFLNESEQPEHVPISITKEIDGVTVDVCLQYTRGDGKLEMCFTNNAYNKDGGTHLSGFRGGLTRAIGAYGKKENIFKDIEIRGDDYREGLTAVISVSHPDPSFESQTKVKLTTPDVEGQVSSVVYEALQEYLEKNPKEAKKICEKVRLTAEARIAAKKARDAVRDRKTALSGGGLPGKLYDCTTRERDKSELFLVEGDSAGGSAESGRNRQFQAILPLRGKVLNVEKARLEKLLDNNEISALISAIGIDIDNVEDVSKVRYGKVIIMSVDAEEHVFVRDGGGTRMTTIGAFIDAALADAPGAERLVGGDLGEVLCFGTNDQRVRFRPIRAVIRHPLEEALYEVRTAYGRSVRVTASHSVFVAENGAVRLKRGDELKPGDLVVAPRTTRFPDDAPERLDLLRALHAVPEAAEQVWVRGAAVAEWRAAVPVGAGYEAKPARAERGTTRAQVRLADIPADELAFFDDRDDLELTPEHFAHKAVKRFVEVTPALLTLLGFYLAEGSCSDRNGVRLTTGSGNVAMLGELTDALAEAFGQAPTYYEGTEGRAGELKLVNRVAALAWQHLFGFAGADSLTKKVPDLAFNVSEELRFAFLRGYFNGDGTGADGRIMFATSSRDLASGLVYLLSSFGVVPSMSRYEPDGTVREVRGQPCQTKHPHWHITVTARDDLARLRPVWGDHRSASAVGSKLNGTFPSVNRRFVPLDGDLMGLPIESVTAVQPSNGNVYDFSVEGDENFVAGMGGVCCHNTDADVDGQHIRTLLLTFFFRQMRKLIEAGHVFVARPPLFKITQKKETRFVMTREEILGELTTRGLKGTTLHVTIPDTPARELNEEAMAKLLTVLADAEAAVVGLERRGRTLDDLNAHATDGTFPVFHVVERDGGKEHWFRTADEVAAFKTAFAEKLTREPVPGVDYELDEWHELKSLNRALAKLRDFGFGHADLVPLPRIAGREPPVRYALDNGDSRKPFASLRELVAEVRKLGEKGLSVMRFKGLGEMDPEELWATTLDPAHRTLMKVTLNDAFKAEEMFRTLMGKEVQERRAFIFKNSLKSVDEIDYGA
jgi:DNA gyrase subunit B